MINLPVIDPVALNLGPLKVHWYGIMYLVGFSAAWYLGRIRCLRSNGIWKEHEFNDAIFYCALGVVLGGRFGYVFFYQFDFWMENPLWIFKIWEGGMSFHGGFIGVIIASWTYGKKISKSLFEMSDFLAPLVPIGLGAGRMGNFIGGELWGRATDVSWAVVFPTDPEQLTRHPSQLYQCFIEGMVLFVLLWIYSSKPRPIMAVSGMFLLAYGLGRFSMEFFRAPDAHLGLVGWNFLSMGQILSVPMIVFGMVILHLAYRDTNVRTS